MDVEISPPVNDPNLLILLAYLKLAYKKLIMPCLPTLSVSEENLFHAECVKAYDQFGCPGLALKMISDYHLDKKPNLEICQLDLTDPKDTSSLKVDSSVTNDSKPSNGLDWGELETTKPSTGLDWGELETTKPSTGLDWGELDTPNSKNDTNGEENIEVKSAEIPTVLGLTEEEAFRLRVRYLNMCSYKKLLILRLLHVWKITNILTAF